MKYEITVKSITAYMQHRMDDLNLAAWEKSRPMIHERPGVNWEITKEAEFRCYRNSAGKCYIPKVHIKGALIAAGGMYKSKVGGRSRSMAYIIAAMFRITPEEIELPDYDAIDRQSAVNKAIKGRVMVTRPKWTSWEASFTLDTRTDDFTDQQLVDLITTAGNAIGIGSFRITPSKGEYGQFEIKSFKQLKETAKPARK
jgi:hypothetical protein